MQDVTVKFERENIDGLVAVNTYLIDVFRRFGVRFLHECDPVNDVHFCESVISSGIDVLSPLTATEEEHFAETGRTPNERLACEARIIKPGEIVIMTTKKEEPKVEEAAKAGIQDEFNALPLEKKIANLLKMEVVTLGETFSYVLNSPYKVVEKVGEVMAEFGMKIEKEAKKATRPKETTAKSDTKSPPKAKPARKATPPREAKA